jgi:hypothetical protein
MSDILLKDLIYIKKGVLTSEQCDDLILEKGDAVIFPANPFFIHEVTEVTEGRRYSVNSFLTSLPHEDVVYFQDYWNSVLDLPNVKDNPMRYNLTS